MHRVKLRRPRAAFFLCVLCIGLQPLAAEAAARPQAIEKQTNINQQSEFKSAKKGSPVTFTRDILPDISEVFGGYNEEELPEHLPTASAERQVYDTPRPEPRIQEDGMVILEFRLGNTELADAVVGYSERGMLLLPIGQTAQILQLPIQLQLDAKRAEGWFSEQDQTFLLDAANARVSLAGNLESIDRARYDIRDDDIYVDSRLLGEWFSVNFDFSFSEQMVQVSATGGHKLPIELLADRTLAREALKLKRQDASIDAPTIREPYKAYTVPFADVNTNVNYDSATAESKRADASILMNSDLLYMQQNSYFSYSKTGGLTNARVTLSRRDPEGKLFANDEKIHQTALGEMAEQYNVTAVELGDMYSDQIPLTMLNQNGRGVMVTNQPLDRSTQFDRTTIDGDIQPGWDIELYRNEELLAFQQSNATGRYEFNDVPLLSGLNLLRLVFYGPYGETREEIRRVLVNPNITKKDVSYFKFLAMQQSKNLIHSSNSDNVFTTSLLPGFGNSFNNDTTGKARLGFEYEYGIEDNLALYAQATQTPISDADETRALTLGLGSVWQDIYTRANIARSDSGGHAMQLIAQTNLYGVNVSAEHQIFREFFSDYTEDLQDPVTARSILRADGSIGFFELPRFSLGVAAARTDYISGSVRDELNQRTTTSLFGTASFNHNVLMTRTTTPGSATLNQTRGNLLLSVPAFGAFLRGSVTYGVKPELEWQNAAIALDYQFNEDLLARGEVFHDISSDGRTSTTISLNKRFEKFSLGGFAGMDSRGDKTLGLSLNFAIGQEPRNGTIDTYADPLSNYGIVTARSFIDTNQNQRFDDDESLLDDINYLVNQGTGMRKTQENIHKSTLIKQVPTDEKVNVMVNPASLPDPFLVVGDSAVNVIARPGVPMFIDFPVQHAADVEGTVTMVQDGQSVEAMNVLVEAVNEYGQVVRSSRSAFDGLYLLELLPTGKYKIRISPEQVERLGFKKTTERDLVVQQSDEYLQGVDLTVKR